MSLTLEGSPGPSSVMLSDADCLALAEAIAFLRPLGGNPDPASETPSSPGAGNAAAVRAMLGSFPIGSSLRPWLEALFDPTGKGDHAGAAARIAAALRRAGADLGPSRAIPVSTAGRVLLAVVEFAGQAWSAHAGFERAVVEARVEAMKQLAYGAGHEINNPLANIATRAQALLPGESDPGRRRRLAGIVDQAFRARDMIGGLMLFARPPKAHAAPVSALELIEAAVVSMNGLAAQRGVGIEMVPPTTSMVGAWDRSQVEEAIRSVLTNAVEAGKSGGRVRIEAVESRAVDRPVSCVISISDDGPGMDRQTLAAAFDPFFSGREAGRGIGLGLPKVWRLIEINGGHTTIESRYGAGTTVTLVLPLDGRKVDASSPA